MNVEPLRDVCDLAYLCSCAVKGSVPDSTRVAAMNVSSVQSLATAHMLGAAAAVALRSAGVKDEASQRSLTLAAFRDVQQRKAWEVVKAGLEERHIWYALLKGAVVRQFYPQPLIREMVDHDVLFDATRADDVRAMMEGLGYRTVSYGTSCDDDYLKAPLLNFEMHRSLFGTEHDRCLYEYWSDVEQRLMHRGKWERCMKPEDLYLYICSHSYKHHLNGGIGLRSLLDVWVCLRSTHLDMSYVEQEAERIGIVEYERACRVLSFRLFDGDELTEADAQLLGFVVESGAFGTTEHRLRSKVDQAGGSRLLYALRRLRVPLREDDPRYSEFLVRFPVFYRHRVMLPLLPVWRLLLALRSGVVARERMALKALAKNDVNGH